MKTMIVKVYPNESVPPAVECDCDVNCNGLMINVTFTNLVITAGIQMTKDASMMIVWINNTI